MIKIDRGIPIPEWNRKLAGRKKGYPHRRYPWREMEAGDSFLVECGPHDKSYVQTSLSGTCRRLAKEGLNFVTRQVDRGVRIWRV